MKTIITLISITSNSKSILHKKGLATSVGDEGGRAGRAGNAGVRLWNAQRVAVDIGGKRIEQHHVAFSNAIPAHGRLNPNG